MPSSKDGRELLLRGRRGRAHGTHGRGSGSLGRALMLLTELAGRGVAMTGWNRGEGEFHVTYADLMAPVKQV